MSERKVLNKYYPPDFDPSKIPRMKLPKNRQYTVRLMAPFNMRCVTCGEYIYKGKKFNARKEDVEGQDYLGIRIYRFYIKCTRCLQEISFKTDPKNTDYEIEAGATRNFMALKLAEEQAQREEDERREDEATNPMKLLENRTKQSKQELELLESLEELRDLNRRQRSVDYDSMLSQYDNKDVLKKLEEQQEAEDEKFIKSVFGSKKKVVEEEIIEETSASSAVTNSIASMKRTADDSKPLLQSTCTSSKMFESSRDEPQSKMLRISSNEDKEDSDKKVSESSQSKRTLSKPVGVQWNKSIGAVNNKKGALAGLVRIKKPISSEQSSGCDQKQPSASDAKDNKTASSALTGLSLLGSYSDSDSDGS
ncbi:hypothetical protein R5R35_011229 [Gryllus longicercus]|uniref:Splicing factor YJU2 n=1 Tax=Gryllus longicercus TaxID=2509291 RepID=A0AAN9VDH6_9ORTH